MFRSIATAAVIVLATATATATASLASTGWSTGDVNMRQGPGTGYYTVGAIPRCASFTVYAEDRGWYQVNWRGVVGWVSGRYVAYNDSHCHYQAPVQRAPRYQPQYQARPTVVATERTRSQQVSAKGWFREGPALFCCWHMAR